MHVSRRAFLGVAAASLGAGALAACAAIDPNATPQENLANVVTDVNDIAGAFMKVLPQIAAINGVPTSVIATVTSAVDEMQVVAQALSKAALSTTAAQPLVQKIETDVNAVVDAVASLPLPSSVSSVIQAASILLPIIEAAVNLSVTTPAVKASSMSPDEARAVLRLTRLSH